MRKGKKALLIAAAMILTIAALAVLNFVRSKMETNEPSANPAALRVVVSGTSHPLTPRHYVSWLAASARLKVSPRLAAPASGATNSHPISPFPQNLKIQAVIKVAML